MKNPKKIKEKQRKKMEVAPKCVCPDRAIILQFVITAHLLPNIAWAHFSPRLVVAFTISSKRAQPARHGKSTKTSFQYITFCENIVTLTDRNKIFALEMGSIIKFAWHFV